MNLKKMIIKELHEMQKKETEIVNNILTTDLVNIKETPNEFKERVRNMQEDLYMETAENIINKMKDK